ncbi:MAG: YIP1 family protein, partial [Acidobacteriota bacterium]|nr:YIP1 family protein [Acidobacteriota bacterium]
MTAPSDKTAAPAPAVSAPARVVGTFFSPVSTFESIAARPGFILPILLWTAASLLVTSFLLPKIDFDRMIRSSIEKRGQPVPEERIQSIVARQKRMAPVLYNVIGAVSPALICLLVTLIYWASFKAFGWDFTFRQGFGATAHAFLPGVLGAFVLLVILTRQETVDPTAMGDLLRSNLGFLVDKKSSPALHSLLESLDLFSL